ncbi:MAG: HAD-IIIA family hydrolase [Pseudomonadota bacterium]|nr:HAD-IIIA family hydrolase [Pseudomonadota bacterium]
MAKAFFLDRDGILNKAIVRNGKPYAPITDEEFKINTKFLSTIKYLKSLNYILIIITNQPDVQKKILKRSQVNKFNLLLKNYFKIDDIFVSFSNNNKNYRRKPNPGMLLEAKNRWNINFRKSYFVGDRKSDIDAGTKVGVKTIFVDRNYKEKKPTNYNFKITNLNRIKLLIKR